MVVFALYCGVVVTRPRKGLLSHCAVASAGDDNKSSPLAVYTGGKDGGGGGDGAGSQKKHKLAIG